MTRRSKVLLLLLAALGVAAGTGGVSSASQVSSVPVTVRITGKGTVASSPRGLSCPKTCSYGFPAGARVQLKATAAPGWSFVGWFGPCRKPTSRTCTVPVGTPVFLRAVFALNATASPPASGGKAEVWIGPVTMETSRQYMYNGSVVNACSTNWDGKLSFRIGATGAVSGVGHVKLTAPRSCTAKGPFAPQVEKTTFSIGGSKDPKRLALLFGARKVDNEPKGTGEFGGLVLLYTPIPSCPPVERPIDLPLVTPRSARLDATLTGHLTGCGGSGKDVVKMALHVFVYRFNCGNKPPPNADPELVKLCS
jgi:hypothetical protein